MSAPSLVDQVTSIVEQHLRSREAIAADTRIAALLDAETSPGTGEATSERYAEELAAANTLALLAIARYLDDQRHAFASAAGAPLIPSGLG
jgi:hypothetical protein